MKEPSIDFDKLLQQNDEALRQVAEGAFTAQGHLVNACAGALEKWYLEFAGEAVKSHPKRASELGKELLREMKDQIRDLGKGAKSQVEKHLKNAGLWWDGNGSAKKLADKSHLVTDQALIETFDRCRAEIDRILAKNGFAAEPSKGFEQYCHANEPIPGAVRGGISELTSQYKHKITYRGA